MNPAREAWDLDGTIVLDNYAAMSPMDYLDGARFLGTQVNEAVVEHLRQCLRTGVKVRVITGRSQDMAPWIRQRLAALGLRTLEVLCAPPFEGDEKLAWWKAGALQSWRATQYVGDRKWDEMAANLAGVSFAYVHEASKWLRGKEIQIGVV